MSDIYNFEVTHSNFNQLVITNSYKLPVFALFMNPSIGTCFQMEQRLAGFAEMFAGKCVLAKIDTDMDEDLREQYEITNVPALKVFQDGEPVHHEVGLMEMPDLFALFKQFGLSRESDDMRQKARRLYQAGDIAATIQTLTEAIQIDPSNTQVAMDMIQVMLDIELLDDAKGLFNKLPVSDKESVVGRNLTAQLIFKDMAAETEGKEALLAKLETDGNDYEARYDLAICYFAKRQYADGMEQLFAIVEKDPEFQNGAAQEMALNIIEMLKPNDSQQANQLRQKLGNYLNT